ncbi:MAG: TrkA family potassium uptake protein [Candidatus Aenigmarchaeota archaeon]|nr:TrkA family potassium uptake protein [Candidatus Aenigmarchaeota archaeon]
MKIVIVGAGELGRNLVHQLVGHHKVIVVDSDSVVCEAIAAETDATVLKGDVRDPELLSELKLDDVDAVLAVTSSNEINFLIASYARKKGVNRVIARASEEQYAAIMKELAIEPFIPSISAAERLALSISRPVVHQLVTEGIGNLEVYDLAIREKHIEILDFRIRTKLVGKTLADLPKHDIFRVISVFRKGSFVLPDDRFRLDEDDYLVILCEKKRLRDVIRVFEK